MKIFDRNKDLDNDPFCGIEMGDQAKDTLSGFEGIVIVRTEYLTGCNQVFLLPSSEKGNELKDGHWFDVERVELLVKQKVTVKSRRAGADVPPPVVAGRRSV